MAHKKEPGKYTNAMPSYTQCVVTVETKSINCGNVASTVEASRISKIAIEVDLSKKVSIMKELINEKWVISPEDQILSFGSVLLRDHQNVGSYGIVSGSKLTLDKRVRTPPPI